MKDARWKAYLLIIALIGSVFGVWRLAGGNSGDPRRDEVLFWHFWGGEEAKIVEQIVQGFNGSQDKFEVRAVAMPGNNLDIKFFLAVAGGAPPDLVNQDDPVLGDWGSRDAIVPLSQIVPPAEYQELEPWLYPAARKLGTYRSQLYGLCNGLDVRAIYFNQSLLDQLDLAAPRTIEELDQITNQIAGSTADSTFHGIPFLPNPRNLWAWGIVFGGSFADEPSEQPTLTNPGIERALTWMAAYGKRYGAIATSLRARDQSLAGKKFPLLLGHYAFVEDGQWRCRDIDRYVSETQARGDLPMKVGVIPFPAPTGADSDPQKGRVNGGWINGNFFVVPKGCRHPEGAWAFMKYWSGFGGGEAVAARHCVAGGWIPPSNMVASQPEYATMLEQQPLFRVFVELAASPHQVPRPNLRGGALLDREVRNVAEEALMRGGPEAVPSILQRAQQRLQESWPVPRGGPR
jgi:multiple sugar transport system substrate-binding protein